MTPRLNLFKAAPALMNAIVDALRETPHPTHAPSRLRWEKAATTRRKSSV